MRRCRSFSRMCLFSMPPSATTLPCSAASRRRNWRRPYAVRSWKPCSQSAARTISAGKAAAASPAARSSASLLREVFSSTRLFCWLTRQPPRWMHRRHIRSQTISCPCPALRASSSRTRWNRRRCAAMTAFSF